MVDAAAINDQLCVEADEYCSGEAGAESGLSENGGECAYMIQGAACKVIFSLKG